MKFYVIYNFSTILDCGKMTPEQFENLYSSYQEVHKSLSFQVFDREDEYESFMDRFYSTGME